MKCRKLGPGRTIQYKKLVGLILILCVPISGCSTSGIHLFKTQVSGEVRENSVLKQPLKDVQVLNPKGTILGTTNASGHFLVEVYPEDGIVELFFEHTDFESGSMKIAIDGTNTQYIKAPTLFLKPPGVTISGQIQRQLVSPKDISNSDKKPLISEKMADIEPQAVPGEYNLVTHKGEEWLKDRLKGMGQILYSSPGGFYTIKLEYSTDTKTTNSETIDRKTKYSTDIEGATFNNFSILEELIASGEVEYITPNYLLQTQGVVDEPENELDLWNMQMLNMSSVWEYSTGEGVLVAVIDTLHTSAHPELPNIIQPYFDITGEGENLYLNTHGLHVAGIIGAIKNDVGVVGVASGVSLLPIRVFNRTETATISDIVQGIYLAIEAKADIINMSFGTARLSDPTYNFPDLHTAIIDAYEAGIVLVAASGNYGYDFLLYPAAYPEVIGVGAVNIKGERASYSQYGSGLELMAPGGDHNVGVVSTGWDFNAKKYGYLDIYGTSMAAPHVTGIIALLISSGITDPDYIRLLLRESAIDLGEPGYDPEFGYGLVDPFTVLYRFAHSYVFFGYVEEGFAQIRSQVIQVEANGTYELGGVRPGIGKVVGWIDLNNNLLIDGGDYLGESAEVQIVQGMETLSNVDVELKLLPGEFSAIDIGAILWDN